MGEFSEKTKNLGFFFREKKRKDLEIMEKKRVLKTFNCQKKTVNPPSSHPYLIHFFNKNHRVSLECALITVSLMLYQKIIVGFRARKYTVIYPKIIYEIHIIHTPCFMYPVRRDILSYSYLEGARLMKEPISYFPKPIL